MHNCVSPFSIFNHHHFLNHSTLIPHPSSLIPHPSSLFSLQPILHHIPLIQLLVFVGKADDAATDHHQ